VDDTLGYMGPHQEAADVAGDQTAPAAASPPAPVWQFIPFMTGKRMLTNQTFRDLFRTETIGPGGLQIKSLAIVFSDLQASTALAIQTNHQIDYFGRAVNVAARVQSVAAGGEIVVTDTIWDMPAIPEPVQDYGLQSRPDKVQLRGIADNVPVHRLF
jgi:hypothetical protein